jgi:hypothetical protein
MATAICNAFAPKDYLPATILQTEAALSKEENASSSARYSSPSGAPFEKNNFFTDNDSAVGGTVCKKRAKHVTWDETSTTVKKSSLDETANPDTNDDANHKSGAFSDPGTYADYGPINPGPFANPGPSAGVAEGNVVRNTLTTHLLLSGSNTSGVTNASPLINVPPVAPVAPMVRTMNVSLLPRSQ